MPLYKLPGFKQQVITSSVAVANGSADLKALASFYDRIIILDGSAFRTDVREAVGLEIDYLVNEGIIDIRPIPAVFEVALPKKYDELVEDTYNQSLASLFAAEHSADKVKTIALAASGLARLEAIRQRSANPGVTFVPHVLAESLMSSKVSTQLQEDRSLEVMELVFRKMPIPAEDTPWQDILDFRNDDYTKFSAFNLYRWMHGNFKEQDFAMLEGTLEVELFELTKLIEIHRKKVRYLPIKILATLSDAVTSLLSLHAFSAISSIDVRKVMIDLMDAELKIRSQDLYFLFAAHKQLGPNQN